MTSALECEGYASQVKGEKPPAPTRGLSKRSATAGADTRDDADDVDDDNADAAAASPAAADMIPRTDIRFVGSACDVVPMLKLSHLNAWLCVPFDVNGWLGGVMASHPF